MASRASEILPSRALRRRSRNCPQARRRKLGQGHRQAAEDGRGASPRRVPGSGLPLGTSAGRDCFAASCRRRPCGHPGGSENEGLDRGSRNGPSRAPCSLQHDPGWTDGCQPLQLPGPSWTSTGATCSGCRHLGHDGSPYTSGSTTPRYGPPTGSLQPARDTATGCHLSAAAGLGPSCQLSLSATCQLPCRWANDCRCRNTASGTITCAQTQTSPQNRRGGPSLHLPVSVPLWPQRFAHTRQRVGKHCVNSTPGSSRSTLAYTPTSGRNAVQPCRRCPAPVMLAVWHTALPGQVVHSATALQPLLRAGGSLWAGGSLASSGIAAGGKKGSQGFSLPCAPQAFLIFFLASGFWGSSVISAPHCFRECFLPLAWTEILALSRPHMCQSDTLVYVSCALHVQNCRCCGHILSQVPFQPPLDPLQLKLKGQTASYFNLTMGIYGGVDQQQSTQ